MWRMLLTLLLFQLSGGGVAWCLEDSSARMTGRSVSPDSTRPLAQDMSEASLGIGFDVFPQAFGFAATRVGVPADLHITRCGGERCEYLLGSGITISTDHLSEGLAIHRIEASLDARHSREPAIRFQFEQACLAIVALVDPRAARDEQQATATAISGLSDVALRRFRLGPDSNIRVYGLRVDGAEKTATALRCGAVALQ